MLSQSSKELLKKGKNLLAFSAGVDSSALFFILKENRIEFDIAMVDYAKREQSKKEVEYALSLSSKHNIKIHTLKAPNITTNFESTAREIRYDFFNSLIIQYSYDNLLTAHHLGDRFEWMMMQFCKGAGCMEMAGMREIQTRQNHTLIRPLLHISRDEIYEYLKKNEIKYFEDVTNLDEDIQRNHFRHNYTNPLLKQHLKGIKKSFNYLDDDRDILRKEVGIYSLDDMTYMLSTSNKRADIYNIDKVLKSRNYMLSASQRKQLKTLKTLVVGRVFIVSYYKEFIIILPYKQSVIVMEHKFKERCRVLKIDPKIRPFLYENEKVFEWFLTV